MYIANVNNKSEITLEADFKNKITKNKNESFTIENFNKKFIADIVSIDEDSKQVIIKIKQNKYVVDIKEPIDILLNKIGINYTTTKKINNLKAPMPGLVLKIMVKEGDAIKKGEPLLLLEAMKMENVFKAPLDVIIKEIKITEKTVVEKGQELIIFA